MTSIVAERWCPRIDESNDRLETGMQRIASNWFRAGTDQGGFTIER